MSCTKYNTIYLDGIDKSGKDLIAEYIVLLSKYRYIVNCRGIMSVLAYSEIFDRDYQYDISDQSTIVNVLLEVNKDDWLIRCKLSNETLIDFEKHTAAFRNAYYAIENVSNCMIVNTSLSSPYLIAKEIVNYANRLNGLKEI